MPPEKFNLSNFFNGKPKLKLEEALDIARNFKGTRNADWTPIMMPLKEIDPNTPLPNMEMCLVPVGKFMMGGDLVDHGKAIHEQRITKPYWIARYPVTNAQWLAAVKAGIVKQPPDYKGPEESKNNPFEWYQDKAMAECPVVGVNWLESRKFAGWLNCELPPENLWEYAACGVENLAYPWGNSWENGERVVWLYDSDNKTNSVKSKPEGASWVGAEHLSGNVWEWSLSAYMNYPYVSSDGREETTNIDIQRGLRGASWHDHDADYFCAAYRFYLKPIYGASFIGSRVFRF